MLFVALLAAGANAAAEIPNCLAMLEAKLEAKLKLIQITHTSIPTSSRSAPKNLRIPPSYESSTQSWMVRQKKQNAIFVQEMTNFGIGSFSPGYEEVNMNPCS